MSATKKIIGREPHPENRHDKRNLNPTLVISLDDATYPTSNWSLGGVLLLDYYGRRTPGMEIEGSVRLATEHESHRFKGAVVRKDLRAGHLALHFIELSEGAFALLDGASIGIKR